MKKRFTRFNSISLVILLFICLGLTSFPVQAKQYTIVIDPGCQSIKNTTKDYIGPGEWKRVSEDLVGAQGVVTKNKEYDINLLVAQKVKDLLSKDNYQVELTRTENAVKMTNSERAMVANALSADLYISIHASDPGNKKGITVVCETEDNPYNFKNYRNSRLLADTILGSLADKTNATNYQVKESDELMGINWCTVPNAIVEIGNINNPDDDKKLADESYQDKVAEGIVSGIESYFSQK